MRRPNDINDAQWQVITHPAQHLLIVAGPGTGKTHTLVYRILNTLEDLSNDKKILAVTFTNKAANEMRARLARYSASYANQVDVGTFHKFCLMLLRAHAERIGLPCDFRIAMRDESVAVAKKLWPDKKTKEIEGILEDAARQKNSGQGVLSSRAASLREAMRQEKLLDFDDILYDGWQLLCGHYDVRAQVQARYNFICVDEYQDINPVQHELLKLAKGAEASITAIGDPRQAIYGFRGSDVRFFHTFAQDFSSAQTLSLSDNYRASASLLKAAGQVIERSNDSTFSPLVARIHTQGRLILHQAASARAQAEYVVHEIEKLIGGTSFFSQDSKRVSGESLGECTFADIAILCRLHSQQDPLKEALDRSGIPFQAYGARPLCEEPEIAETLEALCAMSFKPLEDITQYLLQCKNESKAFERLAELARDAQSTSQFLSEIFLQREDDGYEAKAEKVSLLTMHAAKGLEFAVVFIVGCEEGIVPLSSHGADIGEERRLFYVGMTRAKTILYLTHAAKHLRHGKVVAAQPSPFLADIEEQLKSIEDQGRVRKPKKKDGQLNLFGKR